MELEKRKYIYPKDKIKEYTNKYYNKIMTNVIVCPECKTEHKQRYFWAHTKSKFHLKMLQVREEYLNISNNNISINVG